MFALLSVGTLFSCQPKKDWCLSDKPSGKKISDHERVALVIDTVILSVVAVALLLSVLYSCGVSMGPFNPILQGLTAKIVLGVSIVAIVAIGALDLTKLLRRLW